MKIFYTQAAFCGKFTGEGSGFGAPAEVDGRIIADIQAPVYALYLGIAADEGIAQYNLEEVGIGPDDGILYNGMIEGSMLPDGHVGTDDGVFDIATLGNIYRGNDNGIFVRVVFKRIAAEFFQQRGIRFQQCFLTAAVEPVLHLERLEFGPALYHAFQRIGEVELAVIFCAGIHNLIEAGYRNVQAG